MNKISAILIGLLITVGCGKSSPTEPLGNDEQQQQCAVGCDGIVRAPSPSEAEAAIIAAGNAVRDAVNRGEIKANRKASWDRLPQIEWRACYFYVDNGYWYSGGTRMSGPNCAAGMTDYGAGRIVIATQNPDRVIALVKWESVNYFLLSIGRGDLADQWQAGKGI